VVRGNGGRPHRGAVHPMGRATGLIPAMQVRNRLARVTLTSHRRP
jgi:hypothetical protein